MRFTITAVLVAAGLAAGGCGSSDSPSAGSAKSPTILDTEKVERSIEQSSLDQRGANARVTCPSGVHQKKGKTFSCTALADGATTRFVVKQIDGSGRVHYEGR